MRNCGPLGPYSKPTLLVTVVMLNVLISIVGLPLSQVGRYLPTYLPTYLPAYLPTCLPCPHMVGMRCIPTYQVPTYLPNFLPS